MPQETFICRGVEIIMTFTPYDFKILANVTVSVLALKTAKAYSISLTSRNKIQSYITILNKLRKCYIWWKNDLFR